jgi:prephenate dehydrogenase
MRIAFLGFGLIAGSIARAVRANGDVAGWTMAAWSPSGAGPANAEADGTIDRAAGTPAEAIDGADIVVLAAPVPACLASMDELAAAVGAELAPDAVVTDVASTKGALRRRADELGLRYVGGHPMAGLESTGYGMGRPDLFVGRPWIIVPGSVASPADVARVEALARACGAEAIEMDADVHDQAVAGISHLPLLLAAALVEAVAGATAGEPGPHWDVASRLAAGGWRDMTRLARGDAAMGAGIAATNGPALSRRLRDLRSVLEGWQAVLDAPDGPDAAAIEERLRAARARLEAP